MTLDEIMDKVYDAVYAIDPTKTTDAEDKLLEAVREYARAYARFIIPEEAPMPYEKESQEDESDSCDFAIGFNYCRTQMLSRIEEDSK